MDACLISILRRLGWVGLQCKFPFAIWQPNFFTTVVRYMSWLLSPSTTQHLCVIARLVSTVLSFLGSLYSSPWVSSELSSLRKISITFLAPLVRYTFFVDLSYLYNASVALALDQCVLLCSYWTLSYLFSVDGCTVNAQYSVFDIHSVEVVAVYPAELVLWALLGLR